MKMLVNPERLLEKNWRPRHPLRRQHCAARRRCMAGILLLLCIIIFGYIYLTDAQRVRSMASAYLSDLLGGEVTIGSANLTVFEGLRLDDVTLRVDNTNQPDSIIFHARTFLIRYHPAELLEGKLSATQIVAIAPVVMLVENSDTQRWNYQRMWHGVGHPPKRKNSNGLSGPATLPQIILRDAQVAYMEMRDGKTFPLGWYSIEGSLNPSDEEPDRYDFQLQSRGRDAMGPSVDGTIRTEGGVSVAHMQNFTFGPDIKTMLLAEPRQWCEWHQLEGHIEVPKMVYNPNPGGGGPIFRAELVLSDVQMVVHPQEWMSREQNQRVQFMHDFLDSAEKKKWITPNFAQTMRRLSTPDPIRFTQVSGNLVFTQAGIELKGISGKIENNWFNIDGQMSGYSPDAPAHLTISSVAGRDLEIPDMPPDYLGTLPRAAQDLIEHLHPRGTCALSLDIRRNQPDSAPTVSGELDVKDGQFQFADIPYPVSQVTGRLIIGYDPIARMDGVRLLNVVGHGPIGNVNENATMSVDGFVGPLQGVAGAWLHISGTNITGDPLTRSSLPAPAQNALNIFDADAHGLFPKYHCDFSTNVIREPGPGKPFNVETVIDVKDAEGKMAAFPYPLRNFSCQIDIGEGILHVINGRMPHGNGMIGVNGIVRWKTNLSRPTTEPDGPNIQITGTNLPMDDDLAAALPPMQRQWVQNAGLSGNLDFAGRVFSTGNHKPISYDFGASLHDGAVQSPDGTESAMAGLTARLHLTPTRLEIDDLTGRRGPSAVTASAVLDWSSHPHLNLSGAAKDLELSPSLFKMLPQRARDAWNSVQPQGTIDATLQLSDSFGAAPDNLQLHIVPKNLSVTPIALPYRLDNVRGDISVSPQQVTLTGLTAHHGTSKLVISGAGNLAARQDWTLAVSADTLNVDDELLNALPASVFQILNGLKVHGNIGLDLSKLEYWPTGQSATQPSGADVDFAAKITMQGTSLEVGLPATDVHGTMDLAGLIRSGRLHRLEGQCQVNSAMFAGRQASDLKLTLAKITDDPEIDISHVEGTFAAGDLAGQGDYIYPDSGSSRYDISLVLRDADVRQITNPAGQDIHGRVTASLQMGGTWDDPSSRRGHGNVSVVGEKMYNIPVMLGLMQITNLALPTTSPFSQITTRYALEGQKVEFEDIDLKSNDVSMTGSGEMDFAKRQVSLWLATTNPTLVALPVLGPLLSGANQELLRVHIKGTIEQPTVSASTFDTVTTTVDEVFKGSDEEHQ